ncbi:cytochrome P450 [Mycena polygramma]|nr:cytochrome P450 [Mycena polygramma]
MLSLLQSALALFGGLTLYVVYRRLTRVSLADIPGPEPESWLMGSTREAAQCQAAEADLAWLERFGSVVRVKGILGTDRLLISDPKALHHIYNSGYNIRKQGLRCEITLLLTGPGLAYAQGEDHKRQRKVTSPAFGAPHARAYIPLYLAYATKQLANEWKNLAGNESIVVNTPSYFYRFFLDVIGEVAFDHQFGSTDYQDDELATALGSIIPAMFTIPRKTQIFVMGLMELVPDKIIHLFLKYAPMRSLKISRRVTAVAVALARKLVKQKGEALVEGKGKRDIMSLLVKANVSSDPRSSLNEVEMLASVQTFMQAGHETTANTMSWTMLELAQRPDIQSKLRAEIQATEKAMRARGDTEFTYTDFDSMSYHIAVMKEVLRYHPVSYGTIRECLKADVIPLSKPLVTKSGKTITEIPVPKDQLLLVSTAGYNRNKDVFGPDAHLFNPDRWLDDTVQTQYPLGMYGNLMTFGSGIRGCPGWRFAIYEYQSFLIELSRNFEFSMAPNLASKVRREPTMFMMPTISGEIEKGPQLPITIRAIDNSV